jgi:hypothetical protein
MNFFFSKNFKNTKNDSSVKELKIQIHFIKVLSVDNLMNWEFLGPETQCLINCFDPKIHD